MEGFVMSYSRWSSKVVAVLSAVVVCFGAVRLQAQEQSIDAKWYGSVGIGMIGFEGDEELKDGWLGTIRLGYDYSEWWTFEGGLAIAPVLDENFRVDIDGKEYSRLDEAAGVHDTSAVVAYFDALFHFTRWDRLDPYLTAGGGFVAYADEIAGNQFDAAVRVGGGVMYHFNDEWAIRADGRTFVAGDDTEANIIADAGVVWTWGAGVAPDIVAFGPLDSDGDRLSDSREGELGTDPYNPDTDDDKLTDGEEVLDWKTDPLNPDTDWDGLKDGAEVHVHKTDPNDRDTDDGGVADGHEVIDDFTNPLDPSDDLMLFELYIPFAYDKAVINPEYFKELDIIAKVLSRNETSTAVIEGHADRKTKSNKSYNQKLSERRANAVRDYLVDVQGIEASRLVAKGFGFSRPKAPNDPKAGNPLNRRVEVYIRNSSDSASDVIIAPDADEELDKLLPEDPAPVAEIDPEDK
jgi:outer membrane protein OmpA-like peptidoglycan-associated protein